MKYRDPIVLQAQEKHTGTVILLHGLGDQGDGWSDLASQFQSLKHVKFIFPHAPTRRITLNGGFPMPGWFDIFSLSAIEDQQDKEGILESTRYVQQLIAAEAAEGVPSDRVIVAGFSQGGAIALQLLNTDVKLAGVIGLSTWLALRPAGNHVSEVNKATPILMCHGDADQVVQYSYGKATADRLTGEGCDVQFKTYKGMAHSSSPTELKDVFAFLKARLPTV